MTSEICSALTPVLMSNDLITCAPRTGAATFARVPPNLPTAVRCAPTMTTSFMSEEPQCFGRIADQQVLRLLIVIQHHLVGLAADPELFVSSERRVRGIGVITVRPDATGLDCAAHAVARVGIAGPHAGTETVQCVVRNLQRLTLILESGDRYDWPEDLLLE